MQAVAEQITYEKSERPTADELLEFYDRQNHRTTQDRVKIEQMLENTTCFVTARHNGALIGIARGMTDGVVGHLAECKLDPAYQGPACVTHTDGRIEHDTSGIARDMAILVIEALRGRGADRIQVLAYGTEVDFCSELGFRPMRGVVALERQAKAPLPGGGSARSRTNR